MAYISGTITEDSKIIVLDSNYNKITSKDFTPDNYTKLLLHFDEAALVDSCATPKILTPVNGAARSATQSKFGGYSAYFDGSNDYITIPTSQDFAFGTGDFTIDCWLYLTVPINQSSNDVRQVWQAGRIWTNGYSACDIQFGHHSTWGSGTKLIFRWTTNEIQNIASIASVTLNDSVWYHLAIVRNSGIVTYYINGQALSSGSSFTYDITLSGGSSAYVGVQDWNGSFYWYFKGYIEEFRISKGIARWTANFTPPTQAYKDPTPFVYNLNGSDRYSYTINSLSTTSGTVIAVSNEGEIAGYQTTDYISDVDSYTKLLLHFDESPLVDTMGKTLILQGGVARSVGQTKFGGYSGYFDGSDDYMIISYSEDWNFGSGDFTIDCWVYSTASAGNACAILHTNDTSNYIGLYSNYSTSTFTPMFSYEGWAASGLKTTGNLATGWHHIAIVRQGTNIKLFVDGVLNNQRSDFNKNNFNNTGLLLGNSSWNNCMKGYIDELRVSKGIARWTSDFTLPISAYI